MPIALNQSSIEKVYIYADDGVDEISLKNTEYSLRELISAKYKIEFITSDEVKKGEWVKDAKLFIMPGGADIPYTKKLNGEGNIIIKEYVKNGGKYLSFCAGSYYGSKSVEFDKGGKLEVLGDRELAFFNGVAIGPALKSYSYNSESGASAAAIQLNTDEMLVVYQNGGPYFESNDGFKNTKIIAWYAGLNPKTRAAIISIKVGKGLAILSGVHFEYSAALLDQTDPYIQKIYPQLKLYETERKDFFTSIMNKLGLNTVVLTCLQHKA